MKILDDFEVTQEASPKTCFIPIIYTIDTVYCESSCKIKQDGRCSLVLIEMFLAKLVHQKAKWWLLDGVELSTDYGTRGTRRQTFSVNFRKQSI